MRLHYECDCEQRGGQRRPHTVAIDILLLEVDGDLKTVEVTDVGEDEVDGQVRAILQVI